MLIRLRIGITGEPLWVQHWERPLGRSRRRWEDNIRINLTEIGINTRNWIDWARDRNYWRDLVNVALNLRVSLIMELVCCLANAWSILKRWPWFDLFVIWKMTYNRKVLFLVQPQHVLFHMDCNIILNRYIIHWSKPICFTAFSHCIPLWITTWIQLNPS
jgi:hypothetical protein